MNDELKALSRVYAEGMTAAGHAVRSGDRYIKVTMHKEDAITLFLHLEKLGCARPGWTEEYLKKTQNGPSWLPKWARELSR